MILIFLYGVFRAFARKEQAADNPWGEGATTLEWTLALTAAIPPVQHTAGNQVSCMSDLQLNHRQPILRPSAGQGTAGDYFALLKPRVMSLVIFTAFVGIVAAPGTLHPLLALVALLAIAVGAGASGALNMWYDADIDAMMRRTSNRAPCRVAPSFPAKRWALALVLAVGSVIALGLLVNLVAAALLAFTIFFYVVIYTMWLKRWTPQNIVIGGAAGAFPPMIGWAAVTGTIDLGAHLALPHHLHVDAAAFLGAGSVPRE